MRFRLGRFAWRIRSSSQAMPCWRDGLKARFRPMPVRLKWGVSDEGYGASVTDESLSLRSAGSNAGMSSRTMLHKVSLSIPR